MPLFISIPPLNRYAALSLLPLHICYAKISFSILSGIPELPLQCALPNTKPTPTHSFHVHFFLQIPLPPAFSKKHAMPSLLTCELSST